MNKKRLFIFSIVMLSLSIFISGCSSNIEAQGKKIVSLATVQPEQHPIYRGLLEFQDYIHENLGDKYEVNIFSSGVIGDNPEVLELLQMGSLDLAVVSGSNMEAFADEYKIFAIPYIFNDEQSFRELMNNEEFTKPIYESTTDKGIKGTSWFANGVNNFYSKDKIETPEDMKGMKVRVQPSDINVRMVEGFDAAAVMLAYGEIYTAIQNSVIDAATNPEMALADMRHGEVANYYSRTEHQIFTDIFVTNTEFMETLTDEEARIFQEGFELSTKVANEVWDDRIAEAIVEAEEMGIEFVEVDKELFKEKQEPVREDILKSNPVLQPLFDKVQELQNQ
ncbi:TRAP transporter substrate-binding protein DctP [Oceanobacillus sp. CAU 1775]